MRMSIGCNRSIGVPARIAGAVSFALAAACSGTSLAAPFVLTDGSFVDGVYELRYYPTGNTWLENGSGSSPASLQAAINELFLTNTGNAGAPAWVPGDAFGNGYLMASGPCGGFFCGANSVHNSAAAATMGWDLSAVTGAVALVELVARNFVFTFDQWVDEATGDTVYGNVATPDAFGSGIYTQMYSHTAPANPDVTAYGAGAVDVTPFLSAGWLSDPQLLELQFGYEIADLNIPARHLQLFRDGVGSGANGFMLRITLVQEQKEGPGGEIDVPEPSSLALLAAGLLGAALRRRRRTGG